MSVTPTRCLTRASWLTPGSSRSVCARAVATTAEKTNDRIAMEEKGMLFIGDLDRCWEEVVHRENAK